MIDDIERLRIRNAERQKAFRRLGIKNDACAICGEDEPELLERDHHDGQNHSDVIRLLCKNHHAKRTSRQRSEHPPVGPNPKNEFEVAARFLLSAADYLEFIIERMRELVDVLLKLAKRGITDIKD